jgi:predicted Rossmann fold nucleotide-binding protein DprA/Smf involved in DNA uptake
MDDICRSLGQDAATVSRTLIMLEVRGIVKRLPGMIYAAS